MKIRNAHWLGLLLISAFWGLAFWYDPWLPEIMPTHWNIHGEADGFMRKPWGVYIFPLIASGLAVLLYVLPVIAPKGFRLEPAQRAYDIIVLVLLVFLLAVMLLVFENARGNELSMNRWIPASIGALVAVLGNYVSKFPKNFFVGIRTPWTLASDEVWFRTHRLASWLMIIGGLTMALLSWLGVPSWWPIAVLLGAMLFPVGYSLWLYRRIHGFRSE